MKTIDKESRIPLYLQLMDIIIEMIKEDNLKENTQLPSERELCELYDISRSTVRQAIQELEREGYIYKVQGKGTFVSPKRYEQDLLEFYSFTEEMKKLNKTPTSRVLDFEIIKADEKIARKLKINIGDKVYVFTRLRLADDEPMMLETSYVPVDRFPNLTKQQLQEKAMYDIFKEEYSVVFTGAEETLEPVVTRAHEAELLDYFEGLPSMMIERITYENGKVIEHTKGIARGDRFKYRVYLGK